MIDCKLLCIGIPFLSLSCSILVYYVSMIPALVHFDSAGGHPFCNGI